MTKYNTGNPVGSADPRDLHDNAQNADYLENGNAERYPDRLGKLRKSRAGMEKAFDDFLAASGYQFLGDYSAGIEVTAYNQVIRDSGEFWRAAAGTVLPYITTGLGMPESGAFVNVGDAFLRQELGSSAAGKGAAIVKTESGESVQTELNSRVFRVSGIASIKTYSVPPGHIFHVNDGWKSGIFDVIAGDYSVELAADTRNGVFVGLLDDPDAATKVAKRRTPDLWDLLWFLNEGETDCTAALAAAEAVVPKGQRVAVASRDITLVDGYTERMQLVGNSKASVLQAGDGASQIIDFGNHKPDWDYHEIDNVTFDGNSKASNGVRFNDNGAASEFGGRWSFNRSMFQNCDKGVFQETGNIGNRYRDCNMRLNNIGMYLQNASGATMHAGAVLVEGCEMNSNALAAVYVNDSQGGLGGYSFKDIVIEGNPGFGLFMDLNGIAPFSGVVFDNVWMEANHSAGSVTIDGVSYTPKDWRLDNCKFVSFRNCYLKSLEMNNSIAIATDCRIDNASPGGLDLSLDSDSVLICDNLMMDGAINEVPFVRSIAWQRKTSTANYSVRGPLATKALPTSGAVLWSENYNGPGPWTFSGTVNRDATSVSDGVIFDTCAELTINDGETLIAPASGTLTPGKWAVWGVHIKRVSGAALTPNLGFDFVLGRAYEKEGQWTRSYGIQEVGSNASYTNRLFFVNNSGAPSTYRIADSYVVEFDSFAEAIEFCNARATVK